MRKKVVLTIVLIASAVAAGLIWMRQSQPLLSACDLVQNPRAFDRKTIRVRGTFSVHFEDFTLEMPHCDASRGVWLAFGGDVAGIVASMANDSFRTPGVDIKVDGVSYGIKKDENFRKLYALIAAGQGNLELFRVTATLSGVFLAVKDPEAVSGYGHLGCCHLFVITGASDVESEPDANLFVHGRVRGADGNPVSGLKVLDDVLGGIPPQTQEATTNDQGEFEFSNSGPLLRVEAPKYRPLAVAVEVGGPPVELKLEDARLSDWQIKACPQAETSSGRIGFSMLFQLPPTMDSELFDHKESGKRTYFVFPRGGSSAADTQLFIFSETGVATDRRAVVDSEWSERRWIKDSAGVVVGIDSRGRLKGGGAWRNVSFGSDETAKYSLEAGQPIALLDTILESACIAKR
jgi:hypothetical protein